MLLVSVYLHLPKLYDNVQLNKSPIKWKKKIYIYIQFINLYFPVRKRAFVCNANDDEED